jgi:hypothetical protein
MIHWQLLYTYGGSDRDVTGYWRNVVGQPIVSAVKIGPGQEADASPTAGVYRFRFETASAVSCRKASPQDSLNPLIYSGSRNVIADYVTENMNLLPGWKMVFRGDVQAGDEFEIGVGCCLDSTSKTWQRILSFGPRVAGFVSEPRTLIAKNVSSVTLTDCKLVATNAIRIANGQGSARPFKCFRQAGILNPEPDSDLDGTEVSFANYTPGSPPTVDLLTSGSPIDMFDEVAGGIIPGGVGLKCDGTTVYRFADGTKYQSGTFILSDSLEQTDTATMFVSDGGSTVWLATPSESFVPGPAGLVLTQDGQTQGYILSNGTALFRIQLAPSSESVPNLNARSFSLRAVGMDGSSMVTEEHRGSFLLAQGEAEVSFRISAVKAVYPRPRYSEDPQNPGHFIPDDDGEYVEDLENPGSYIVASEAQKGGNYRNIWEYLAENGVIIIKV